jgi:hypothetical protein
MPHEAVLPRWIKNNLFYPCSQLDVLDQHRDCVWPSNVPNPCILLKGRCYRATSTLPLTHHGQKVRRKILDASLVQLRVLPEENLSSHLQPHMRTKLGKKVVVTTSYLNGKGRRPWPCRVGTLQP